MIHCVLYYSSNAACPSCWSVEPKFNQRVARALPAAAHSPLPAAPAACAQSAASLLPGPPPVLPVHEPTGIPARGILRWSSLHSGHGAPLCTCSTHSSVTPVFICNMAAHDGDGKLLRAALWHISSTSHGKLRRRYNCRRCTTAVVHTHTQV